MADPQHVKTKGQGLCQIIFDGKGQWKQYLVHFDTVAELYGWDNMERLQYLSVSLRGEACMIMQSLANKEKFTSHKKTILKTESRCFRCFAGYRPKQKFDILEK